MTQESKGNGLLDTIRALPSLGWYYGNITVEQSELILKNEPNGSFLVRDSSDSNNHADIFTVTFKMLNCYGSVRVDYAKGYFSLSLQDPGLPMFRTLMDLVSFCLYRSVTCKQPVCVLTGHKQHNNVSLYLTRPVSRHVNMHSLTYFCREALSQFVTKDKLCKLGLPMRMVEHYLMKNPHFDEQVYSEWDSMEVDAVSRNTTGGSSSSGSVQLDTSGGGGGGNANFP